MAAKSFWQNKPPIRSAPTRRLARWSSNVSAALTKLGNLPPPAKGACVLMLLALVTLLAGCATTSTRSAQSQNPQPPPTTLSESPETFSARAAQSISEWRKRLTELIPK